MKLRETLENSGKLQETSENSGKLWGNSKKLWETLEKLWETLGNSGKLWETLENSRKLWKALRKLLGNSKKLLGNFGKTLADLWKIMEQLLEPLVSRSFPTLFECAAYKTGSLFSLVNSLLDLLKTHFKNLPLTWPRKIAKLYPCLLKSCLIL